MSPAKKFSLTVEQLSFFHSFGYLVLKQVFSTEERHLIDKEFEAALARNYPDMPFDGSFRHYATMMDEDTPFFSSLLDEAPFLPIMKQIYGERTLGICADGNRYVGNSNWHRDTANAQYPAQGVKFALYLQPVGSQTGALRVIPGSHRIPTDDHQFAAGVHKLPIQDVPAVVLDSEPGDVVAFDLRIWHGSWGGKADRRMCTVVYLREPETPSEIEGLLQTAKFNAVGPARDFRTKQKFFYSARWVANSGQNPDRANWIARLKKYGYFDPPGLVEGPNVSEDAKKDLAPARRGHE
ncbi:MAG: phytanoyl-CoA dioxygenase family protein [Planctomycetes bacterium]|nr:phytanoyl-CoA dioxygenase family protein [Planctomycetota bacterium]